MITKNSPSRPGKRNLLNAKAMAGMTIACPSRIITVYITELTKRCSTVLSVIRI